MKAGILGYGFYVPKYRIKAEEYLQYWGYFAASGILEKAVPRFDEDTITMAVDSAKKAIENSGISSNQLDAVYLATTSSPYGEKLASSTVSSAVGAPLKVALADFAASSKAGTSALLCCLDFVLAGRGNYGLVVASDNLLGDPKDSTEHPLSAAAAAFVVGPGETILEFEGAFSIGSEMWGGRYRLADEKFSTEPGIRQLRDLEYSEGVTLSIEGLMEKLDLTKDDFNFVVLQQPDGRLPFRVARELGIIVERIQPGLVVRNMGDVGVVSVPLGLAAVLEIAEPRDRVLLVSHGSGMGSDAISLIVGGKIEGKRPSFTRYVENKHYIDYLTYLKWKRLL